MFREYTPRSFLVNFVQSKGKMCIPELTNAIILMQWAIVHKIPTYIYIYICTNTMSETFYVACKLIAVVMGRQLSIENIVHFLHIIVSHNMQVVCLTNLYSSV